MKTLRFLATADWHADSDPKKTAKLTASLDQMLEYVQKNEVEAIIHAGDIWERKQSYADKSGVPVVVEYLRKLSKYVNFIFITKGNNSHDEPGSVALLHQLEENIYAYEYPVCLGICGTETIFIQPTLDLLREDSKGCSLKYIVSLVPYPTKANFLTEDSIDNNNANFIEKFEQVFELIGDVTQPYTCPKVLAFHGNVVGSRLSSGQSLVSQDIMVAPSTLQKAKADYYALGHIHLAQDVAPNMAYSGSIYNKNWGETEQKSFEVIEFDNSMMMRRKNFLTSARPMVTVEAEFKNGKLLTKFELEEKSWMIDILSKTDPVFASVAEHRVRIKINEDERSTFTDDKVKTLKEIYGEDVKIEINIIPAERESRSEKIMDCKSLVDEVLEYAMVVEEPVHNGFLSKVAQIQESEVF